MELIIPYFDKKNKMDVLILIFFALISIYTGLRNILGVNLPDILITVVCALLFAMFDDEHSYMLWSFLIPFKTSIGLSGIMLVFCAIQFIKEYMRKKTMYTLALYIAFIIILGLMHSIMGIQRYDEYARFSFYLLWIYLLYVALQENRISNIAAVKISYSYVLALLIGTAFMLSINIKNYGLDMVLSGRIRIGGTADLTLLSSYTINYQVNELGSFCAMGIAILLLLMEQSQIKSIVGIPLSIYFTMISIMTLSRTAIIVLLFEIICLVLSKSKKKLRILLVLTAAVLIAVYLYNNGYLKSIDGVIKRFNSDEIATGNGRSLIFEEYNKLLFSNPARILFGFGVYDYSSYTNIGIVAHNGTQELLLSFGFIGAIIFIVIFAKLFSSTKSMTEGYHLSLISYLPFLVKVFTMQFGQFVSQYYSLLMLGVGVICLLIPPRNYGFDKNGIKEQFVEQQLT